MLSILNTCYNNVVNFHLVYVWVEKGIMDKAVALAGMCGSGKTTATRIFENYGWKSIHIDSLAMQELIKKETIWHPGK